MICIALNRSIVDIILVDVDLISAEIYRMII